MPTMRFVVIGCGSIGRRHVGNLVALGAGEVLAFDVRQERRQEVVAQFGVEAPDSLEGAWQRRPDVALIATPTSTHLDLALEATGHGCHLFVEKPLADRREGLERLLEQVREKKLVSLVGCNMRFHPGLAAVKRLLGEGAIGRVVAARVQVGQYLPDWHPAEDYRQSYSARRELGGGIILDAIHEIDYVRWLMGEVEAVACMAGKLGGLEIDTEDTAAILMRFVGGAIGEVHMDYVQRTYSRTCHVIGEGGTIRWDETAGEVRRYSAETGAWEVVPDPVGWTYCQMYTDEMRHFLDCLAGKGKPALDVFEAARVLDITLAAKTSASTQQFVELPLLPAARTGKG